MNQPKQSGVSISHKWSHQRLKYIFYWHLQAFNKFLQNKLSENCIGSFVKNPFWKLQCKQSMQIPHIMILIIAFSGIFRYMDRTWAYSSEQYWISKINKNSYFPRPLIIINIVFSIIFNSII